MRPYFCVPTPDTTITLPGNTAAPLQWGPITTSEQQYLHPLQPRLHPFRYCKAGAGSSRRQCNGAFCRPQSWRIRTHDHPQRHLSGCRPRGRRRGQPLWLGNRGEQPDYHEPGVREILFDPGCKRNPALRYPTKNGATEHWIYMKPSGVSGNNPLFSKAK